MSQRLLIAGVICGLLSFGTRAGAAELLIGAATADITPSRPVALDGQFELRITQKADTPITANILVLESLKGDRVLGEAVIVSCDLVGVSDLLLEQVRKATQQRLPDLDVKKVILTATHTHTAPVVTTSVYDIPKTGVMQVDEYCAFATGRIVDAIEKAWKARQPGSFTWGLGHAAVAENRRAAYADGHAEMYGKTNRPDFRGLEGYEDHDVGSLFFWHNSNKLIAIVVNVACPSQEVEHNTNISADYWHPVRESLRKKHGQDVCVLGWCSAAGDQSPHLMYRSAAEERMRNLRKLTRVEEIARRIVAAVDETFNAVEHDRHAGTILVHKAQTLQLPIRIVTDEEYAATKSLIVGSNLVPVEKRWHEKLLRRYEQQKTSPHPTIAMEIHVLRLGDVAICTNTAELFTDYGVEMKARSPASQTFVVQLAGGDPHQYLPTERAVRGGGYSAIVQSGVIGPNGGQTLVDHTVALLTSLWKEPTQKTK